MNKFFTNPFAIKWKAKLDKIMEARKEEDTDIDECSHMCTSNCRRVGCNCECGNYHCGECNGKRFITKTEWTGTDDSYDVEVRCVCTED